jgi:ribosome biogenesis protein BRX1
MDDICDLLPHSKREGRIERKRVKDQVDGICFERSCNNFLYFESRNHKVSDLYMWLAKSPSGPAFKYSVQNIHSTSELKLTGNCLKYSRPLLSFDGAFDDPSQPFLQLTKELLSHVFNTPKNHPKSKPFIDHVLSFKYFQGKIWFRNY